MTAPTITPAMIRRFPFAVNPARITDEDEADVAQRMWASVKQEQRDCGNTPGAKPPSRRNDWDHDKMQIIYARRAEKAERDRQTIIQILGNRELTLNQITAELKAGGHVSSYDALTTYLRKMRREGMIDFRHQATDTGKVSLWRVVDRGLTPPENIKGKLSKFTPPHIKAERNAWAADMARAGHSSIKIGAALGISQENAAKAANAGGMVYGTNRRPVQHFVEAGR